MSVIPTHYQSASNKQQTGSFREAAASFLKAATTVTLTVATSSFLAMLPIIFGALTSDTKSEKPKQTKPNQPHKIGLTRAEEARLKQLKVVGSEALYKRLDQKIADLEVEPFFYKKQLRLFQMRCKILRQNAKNNMFEITFLCSQRFDQVLNELEFHQPGQEITEISIALGKKASAKFAFPTILSNTIFKLQDCKRSGNCEDCRTNFQTIWQVLTDVPEAGPLAELAIGSSLVVSLKTVCVARVLELGLEQDSLPLTVQQSVRRGPEPGVLEARGQRAVDMLHRLIKYMEPKIIVLKKTVVKEESMTPGVWLTCQMKTGQTRLVFKLNHPVL